MVKINFAYVHRDVDRHGNVRLYFRRRKGEQKIRIRAAPGTPAFQAEYDAARAVAESAAWRIEDTTESSSPQLSLPKQGTYRLLCVQYFSSADFRRLDPRTQRVRRSILESTFNEPIAPGKLETFADFPLTRLTVKGIRVLRDRKADFPQAANARVKAVRQVFAWAIEQERVSANPHAMCHTFAAPLTGSTAGTWTK